MNWFGRLFNKQKLETELQKELRFHLDKQAADHRRAGLDETEARRAAQVQFGGAEQISEQCRDARGTLWLEAIFKDVRVAVRSLCKSPGFTIAAVGTLALGIGANAAIFQLIDAVRLRTLPVKNPEELAQVQLVNTAGRRGAQASAYPALTNPLWERFRDTQDAFSGVLAWWGNNFNLGNGGDSRNANGLFVSGDFFRVLGVQPLLGRVFSAGEDRRGCGLPGAVISYAFWQRELGGEPSVIGRKLMLNFQPVSIIGVTPANFSGLEVGRSYDVAVPICSQAALWTTGNWLDEGTVWWLNVMGRLRPGEPRQEAGVHLRAASAALFRASLPANYPLVNVKDYLNFKLTAAAAGSGVSRLRDQYADPLLLLLATTGLVLLIACANLANLTLARANARGHEFAVRLAIGASRSRLIQQLMTEGCLLTIAGTAAGLLLSNLLSRFLLTLLGEGDALSLDLTFDWRMLAFTTLVASFTCILFGLTPAFQATRTAASEAMKTSGRTLGASRARFGLRQILVITQVALSLVLLVNALLFSESLRNLLAVDPGFQQSGILIGNADFRRMQIAPERLAEFKRDLLQRVRAVPGVAGAAEVDLIPLSGESTSNAVWQEGTDSRRKAEALFNWFSDGYLKTMGIPLLAGRDFDEHDTISSPRVAIVNQAFARELGLGTNVIGKTFRREATPLKPETTFQIAGLVRDTKYYSLRDEPKPIVFLPVGQLDQRGPSMQLAIRSTTALSGTAAALRRSLGQISPLITTSFSPFEETVREGLLRERLMATLSGFFGTLAALIAALGLYGVMSYLVARRTNEIGVRVALGANRREIVTLIMRQTSFLLLIGLVAGAVLSLALAGTAQAMLFGMKSYDAPTMMLAAALLGVVTVAAGYLPARRAAHLDPMVALREE
jgi:putative ABC transport system permease protein